MLLTALAGILLVQDAPAPQTDEPPASEVSEPTGPPTDAATLIEEIGYQHVSYVELAAELAARRARERYLPSLIIPVIGRTDLEDGAQVEIMRAFSVEIAQLEAENNRWAIGQLDPEYFPILYAEAPDMAQQILRWAERDDTSQPAIIAALEPVALSGNYDGAAFAGMADSLAVAEGQPQPYGTQMLCEAGQTALAPILEPEALDERRAALGLPPLDPAAFTGEACESETAETGDGED
ncbi:DUF6624 domain-containing protein [Maricaulis parjimensis]|uniref:DUF6624 domain-containing protein n=1 Tax=Maricaulis parjimensis TaxID=144023 RepID=UPI00193AA761|nr:DUF6624 domain-containing protein [Maricaulis parjimensis]